MGERGNPTVLTQVYRRPLNPHLRKIRAPRRYLVTQFAARFGKNGLLIENAHERTTAANSPRSMLEPIRILRC